MMKKGRSESTASELPMTTEDSQSSSRPGEAALEQHSDLVELQGQTYRCLAEAYYRSDQYRQMTQRYPQLARAIEDARNQPQVPQPPPHRTGRRAELKWERSHGE